MTQQSLFSSHDFLSKYIYFVIYSYCLFLSLSMPRHRSFSNDEKTCVALMVKHHKEDTLKCIAIIVSPTIHYFPYLEKHQSIRQPRL